MNTDQIKGDWKIVKGEVKTQWGKLTNDELEQIAGNREKLLGAVQKSYGIAKEAAEKQVTEFEARTRKNAAAA